MAEGRARLGSTALVVAIGTLGVALVLGTVLSRGDRGGGTGPAGSSYATAPDGAKAAYLLLAELGHRVERRAEPIGDLRGARLAFVLSPQGRQANTDLVGLAEWVEGGGTLVYGVSLFEPDAESLREGLGVPPLALHIAPDTTATLVGDFAPARDLALRLRVDTAGKRGEGIADLARADKGAHALVLTRGAGRIYVVDAYVFSNRGLKAGDNALFLATLAARHGGPDGTVLFDEFVHGFGEPVSLLSIAAWPLRLAVGTGVLALLVYALAVGRRLGPTSPEPAPPRRASIEQIEALAALFAAHKSRAGALAALAAWAGAPAPSAPPRSEADFVAQARALLISGPSKPRT